jgi:hypothetical protein
VNLKFTYLLRTNSLLHVAFLCLLLIILSHSPKPIPAHSPIQHSALYSTQPYTALCPIQHTALYSTLPSTAHSPIQHSAIYSTQPYTALCPIQHTALFRTQPHSVHSLHLLPHAPITLYFLHIISFIHFVSLLTSSSATVNKFK